MADLPANPLKFFAWLAHVLFLWVRTKVIPQDPAAELALKPGIPVCYVLAHRSLSDMLVLHRVCQRYRLPLPEHKKSALRIPGSASFIWLQKLGLIQVQRAGSKEPPSPLMRLVRQAGEDKSMEVQIVPVSVFWGRNPGRDERSIMKLLFFDDEHAGILQKFFIVLAQGRNNFVQLGRPISLRQLVDEGAGTEETARKLRRVLRIHFKRQRNTTMGPSLPSRGLVIRELLNTKVMKEAIQEESRKKKVPLEKAEARAGRYLAEIAAEQKYSVVRLADIFLSRLWNRIFDGIVVRHAHRLREIDQTHEVVYLPAHRSHLDYMLISYSLYFEGFVPPHTAAGINLNFWPVGPLLRRCGAFYIRRSFGGNRLYTAAFTEYVHFLVTRGYPVKFYIEGGRSRTGRLLSPKTGMLAMVVHSYLRKPQKPVVFVPVYIGYDKVMEVRTYLSELRGKSKRKESVGQLFKARSALRTYFGKAYLGFGEPVYLEKYLDDNHAVWRGEGVTADSKPSWMHNVVSKLARDILTQVNSNAVASPVAIVALILLASPTRAMAEDDLLYLIHKLTSALKAAPYSRDVSLPDLTSHEILRHAMAVAKIERFEHTGGDVIFVEEREGVLLTYYRNNLLHLVALPSLVSSFFQHNDRISRDDLIAGACRLYPFLKADLFLRWEASEAPQVMSNVVDALVKEQLLVPEGEGVVRRPDVTSRDFSTLKILSRVLGQTLERYAVSTALLSQYADGKQIDRTSFEDQCQKMAQRISILNGINDPDFFDKSLFHNYVDQLKEQGFASEDGNGVLRVDPAVLQIAESAKSLLSTDIRHSIERVGI